jgi:hypothetical protein
MNLDEMLRIDKELNWEDPIQKRKELEEREKRMEAEKEHERKRFIAEQVDRGKIAPDMAEIALDLLTFYETKGNGHAHVYQEYGQQITRTAGENFRAFIQNQPEGSYKVPTLWEGEGTPGQEVDRRAQQIAKAQGIDYALAVQRVLAEDPPLNRAYMKMRS